MNSRKINFSAGPATLPDEVLEIAKSELLSFKKSGMSIMEIGHRTEEYSDISKKTHALLKNILNISDDYEVISMHGGARAQFAAVPMNLAKHKPKALYQISGLWSKKAFDEANQIIDAKIYRKLNKNFKWDPYEDGHDFAYIHYTPNETVSGVLAPCPDLNMPIIADATSALLAINLDINKHDLIYAAAQKNLGIAGITFLIVKKNLLSNSKVMPFTPGFLRYDNQIQMDSMYNTPSTFSMYMTNLVLEWTVAQGGALALQKRNSTRANIIYKLLSNHEIYKNLVPEDFRSPTNITFSFIDDKTTAKFLLKAEQKNMYFLKGHSAQGGIRISLYNAMTDYGFDRICEFIETFPRIN